MSKSSFNAREVDASEYEPQVVELPESRGSPEEDRGTAGSSSDSDDSSEDSRASSSSSSSTGDQPVEKQSASNGKGGLGEEEDKVQELTDKEREHLWVKKLGEMRQRYLASMTEKERVEFFKTLEV